MEKIGGDLQGEPIFEMKTERLACRRANDRRVLQEQSAVGFEGEAVPTDTPCRWMLACYQVYLIGSGRG